MAKNLTRSDIYASLRSPDPRSVTYWADLSRDPSGRVICTWDHGSGIWIPINFTFEYGGINLPNKYIFDSPEERDFYFMNNPKELYQGNYCATIWKDDEKTVPGPVLYFYNGKKWVDISPAIQGPRGEKGEDGHKGEKGDEGKEGLQGPPGIQGRDGDSATVDAGHTYTISAGADAVVVNTGDTTNAVFDFYIPHGAPGVDGADGAPGTNGTNGTNGKDGDPGKDGKDGIDGTNGVDGTTWIPTISADYILSWVNQGTPTQNVNIRGPKGDKGDPGEDGAPGLPGVNGDPGYNPQIFYTSTQPTTANNGDFWIVPK